MTKHLLRDLNRRMFVDMQEMMCSDPAHVERATHMLSASRHLGRIADRATNIAEDVLFMAPREIIRHRAPQHA